MDSPQAVVDVQIEWNSLVLNAHAHCFAVRFSVVFLFEMTQFSFVNSHETN